MCNRSIIALFSAVCAWAASAAEDGVASKAATPTGVILALGDAILADVPTIVVGTPQGIKAPDAGSSTHDRMLYIAHEAFGLFPIEVTKSLKGEVISKVLFVQRPDAKGVFKNGWRGDLASDGVPRLLFLSPARNLVDYSRAKPMAAFKEFATIKGKITSASPQEVFAAMGLADVVRPETWFDVYDGRGSFRVQLPGVSMKPQDSNTSALDPGRVEAANRLLQPFVLEADFLGELPRIIVAWRDRKTPTAAGGVGNLNALLPSLKTATARQLLQYLAEKSELK